MSESTPLGASVPIRRTRAALIAGFAATAAAVAALSLAVNGAANATTPAAAPNAIPAVDDVPPPLSVETLAYPNAAEIQQQGILLKRGDGNILFEACNGNNDIVVKNRISATSEFCFDVRAKPGFLTLELDDVFAIRTRDYAVTATVTADGQKTVINATVDDYEPIGEGAGGARSAIVELRVTG
ncbi:hypothetical protein ACFQ8C_24835 [Streptomyces sp. NPDC056503]|uniref:hypothetical protein n=1 Tax=Streptomyces sp. NPDC056503 TaxID=3345842 RepID=UPI003690BA90